MNNKQVEINQAENFQIELDNQNYCNKNLCKTKTNKVSFKKPTEITTTFTCTELYPFRSPCVWKQIYQNHYIPINIYIAICDHYNIVYIRIMILYTLLYVTNIRKCTMFSIFNFTYNITQILLISTYSIPFYSTKHIYKCDQIIKRKRRLLPLKMIAMKRFFQFLLSFDSTVVLYA